jgi:hypothetical protein
MRVRERIGKEGDRDRERQKRVFGVVRSETLKIMRQQLEE